MRCFPQLAQYPVRRSRRLRTVTNESADGRRVKLSDAGQAITEWRLLFQDLSDAKMENVRTFFSASEGRLGSFTFLDPVDNLLRWSEGLNEAAWEKDPLLSVSTTDGRIWQMANQGGAAQGITQLVEGPSEYYYTLSMWARGSGGVTLVRGSDRMPSTLTGEWQRLMFAAEGATGEGVRFGLEVAPGGALELFGMQAEAQPAASAYKKTTSRGGVYERARFDQDELRVATTDVGRHDCELKIVHGERF